MLDTTATTRVDVTLSRAQWELVIDGLLAAGLDLGGPGWCFCPDAGDNDICDSCSDNLQRAYEARELAGEINIKIGDRDARTTLVFSAYTWNMAAAALLDGAAFTLDSLGGDCIHVGQEGLCGECAAEAKRTRGMLRLAVHIARRARRAHTRATRRQEVAAQLTRRPRRQRGSRARGRRA
ncbi:hypothetical protein [Nonomuraea recticatena]|uniref:Uncharacterized protein n=1 Tax=Nonomuraea recticatena TaxID=46178 RepID=A0ABP6E3D1_9ACTN